ncbi:hypothetical protein [Microbacterium sediminis]|uniref:Uncharacterized protein n=1 Tax=Microbacterium sediminis TaxID=904291 RepID=A0A1B9NA75_9MICO|nr:hypothetical protein [Microbacterium sediminis]OCG73486.1 hypothetical protein A7J15_07290 [Microbacterium sediminis]QBR73154.1 hypothetical protein E3O41_01005 [Microbacterium sediminis]
MGIEIRSGGAIAVDPESLRELAARLDQAGRWVDSGATGARTAIDVLWRAPQLGHACSWQVDQVQHRMVVLTRDLADLATRVRTTADAYELADLMFQLELAGAWDDPYDAEAFEARMALDARITELAHGNEAAYDEAKELLKDWREDWLAEEQWTEVIESMVVFGPAAAATVRMLLEANRGARTGVIPAGNRLRGTLPRVIVRPVISGATKAPKTLEGAVTRIPDSDQGSQIRVEKYAMADGTSQFVVYIGGTALSDANTFDWPSNFDLYFGRFSASYAATVAALEDAGAKPGDILHTFSFSQGAMVAARLVTEGDYQVKTYVGLGSPVDAMMGEDTLSMQLRHRDDPISLLSNGGTAAGTGNDGSIVVERPLRPAHTLDSYASTAGMVDASDDVRVEAFREVLEGLRQDAVSVEFTEYRTDYAERQLAGVPAKSGGASSGGGVSGSSSSEDGG